MSTAVNFIIFLIVSVTLVLQIYWMVKIKQEGDKLKQEIDNAEVEAKKLADLARCKVCGLCDFKILTEQPFQSLCKNPDLKCDTCPK